jgi:hypothetical protein
VIVTQSMPLDACHVHPNGAVTVTWPLAAPVRDADVGAMLNVQLSPLGPLPACVTVRVWPAIVSMPVRELVDVFAATE